jgi:hypothetical protein
VHVQYAHLDFAAVRTPEVVALVATLDTLLNPFHNTHSPDYQAGVYVFASSYVMMESSPGPQQYAQKAWNPCQQV